ncbi:MAG: hypothetical protein M3Q55_10550 [Acidobacteriota bacterium]|nr:hypothetical protein [Acidobacteriota bacterium]
MPVGAQQMPDPSQMSGVPLPSPELSTGTMTVRVVRGSLSNNLPGQRVELAVEGQSNPRVGTTDAAGRAEFTGLRAGQVVQAAATVGGERIESQRITLPSSGGIRVMLFVPETRGPARPEPTNPRTSDGPAERGIVVLGGETRFIVEQGDESLRVFYILEIVNTARAPVDVGGPLLFDLPTGATSATLLAGSTPQAMVGGTRVTVTGPFAPGKTSLQVGYSLAYRGPRVVIEQSLPAALPQLAVAGETTGGVTMTSTQFAATRDMNADGRTFKVGNGDTLAAGQSIVLEFNNLPHHARWPRYTAFGAAVAIVVIGLLIGFRRGPAPTALTPRDALLASREARFGELAALDARRRDGTIADVAYRAQRERVMSSLEDVYAAIDAQG